MPGRRATWTKTQNATHDKLVRALPNEFQSAVAHSGALDCKTCVNHFQKMHGHVQRIAQTTLKENARKDGTPRTVAEALSSMQQHASDIANSTNASVRPIYKPGEVVTMHRSLKQISDLIGKSKSHAAKVLGNLHDSVLKLERLYK